MSASSSKRKAETLIKTGSKMAKTNVHPFFSGGASSSKSLLNWLPDLGGTCLHGVHNDPTPTSKAALFDLDGTLIRPKDGRKYPKGADDWEWWNSRVKRTLTQAAEDGFSIVIVSNQAGFTGGKADKRRTEWKAKIAQMAAQLPEIPFRVFAATDYDQYRKPLIGIWQALQAIHREQGREIEKEESYFVGDAAGRAGDHSCTDQLFALNCGLKFLTPEEYFLHQKPTPFTLKGFHPSSLPIADALFSPTSTPLLPDESEVSTEIILFVGYPSCGKSSFYEKIFSGTDYVRVNQDTLGSVQKCVKLVKESTSKGRSCVVDNTNRDIATRAKYIAIAQERRIPIRCFNFSASLELAKHNNIYRAYFATTSVGEKRRELLPDSAFYSFRNAYQAPKLEEGFSEVKTINWVFDGTDADRELWNIWSS
ncbi:PNK3P-domain-containing protein [Clavulina sp. PMI_390]|nr:PNK3P-domain-containing protein [Clavulina sp. PMI_390]